MSSDGFHVHGPHDHALEHAAQGGHANDGEHGGHGDAMVNQIAMFTAVLATVGAIFSYMGGLTQANSTIAKNDAAIQKTAASNQWNYYQAKITKQALAEMARDLAPADKKEAYQAKVDRYEKEKADIKVKAEALEEKSHEFDEQSEADMHQHHRWAQATTVLQVAIALAAISLLTRKRWLEYAMFGTAGVGVLVGVAAVMHL